MNRTKELAPRRRFPGFSDAGWTVARLDALADRIVKKNRHGDLFRVLTNSALEGVVDQEEYFDRKIANQEHLAHYFVVEKGDYVYNPRISAAAPVGPVSKNRLGTGVVSPLYMVFRFKKEENDFYEHFFRTNLWHAYIKNHSNMGARHDRITISANRFMEMPLPLASPEEQRKIADCLSSLDELIDAESRKWKALKTYKKGMMQKLLPAEGSPVPQWRFPEFQNSGEWETGTVKGCFCTVVPPKKLLRSQYGALGKYPIIDQSQEYIAGWTDEEEAVVFHQRPVIVFGDHTCVLKFVPRPFAQGADGIKILAARDALDERFAYYCLENIPLNPDGYKRHYSALKEFPVKFPDKNSGEQQKIADCLSEMDALIAAQSRKVELLKTHRRGLTQDLFPSLGGAGV